MTTTTSTTLALVRAAHAGDLETVQRLVLLRDENNNDNDDDDEDDENNNNNNDESSTTTTIVNTCDSLGQTALDAACRQGHVHVVHFLLRHGAVHTVSRRGGWRPLHAACVGNKNSNNKQQQQKNTVRIIEQLLLWSSSSSSSHRHAAGVDMMLIQDRLRNGQTALHVAAARGNGPAVHALVSWCLSRQPPNDHYELLLLAVEKRGWTALHLAAYYGHVDVVQYFLSLPILPRVVDALVDAKTTHEGHTAFFLAATACRTVGRTTVLRLLLQYQQQRQQRRSSSTSTNTLVDCPDALGRTALYHAVKRRDTAMVRFLLFTAGATVRPVDLIHAAQQQEDDADDAIYALTTAAVPQGLFAVSSIRVQA